MANSVKIPSGILDKNTFNESLFDSHIIIRRKFSGKILKPEEFHEFQKIVNERRPYCSSDFKNQHFFPDL